MDQTFLQDLTVIFFLSAAVLFIAWRLKLPMIVGLLLTGVICGPQGLKLIQAVNEVEVVANIGLILLLFTIGMEFSLERIWLLRKGFFFGGLIQMSLMSLCGFVVAWGLSRPIGEGIFLGFLLAMSSTAIVLKYLSDQKEENTLHGRLSLAILIFQDLMTVPILLFVPVMAGFQSADLMTLVLLAGKCVLLVGFVIFAGIYVVPLLLHLVTLSNMRELFLLNVLGLCFLITWMASQMGLTPSLGAFLAGLTLAKTDYRFQISGYLLPLLDILMSLFFISIGMLLDLHVLAKMPLLIVSLSLILLVTKAFVGGFAAFLLGMPLRTIVMTGLALAQIGEFSFIILKVGIGYGIANTDYYQVFLAVSLITMALSSIWMSHGSAVFQWINRLFSKQIQSKFVPSTKAENLTSHVVIIGYGVTGCALAKGCKLAGIPYAIIELNPQIVREARSQGEPIFFGDAIHYHVFQQVHISHAHTVVVAIDDPQAETKAIKAIRYHHPKIEILVRCDHLRDKKKVLEMGANEVVLGDVEVSFKLFSILLKKSSLAENVKEKLHKKIRKEIFEDVSPDPFLFLEHL